jgi:nucleoside-diphosphate-sugar epimerase
LVLEKGVSGARYHAVAEEGVSAKEIAEAIARGLKVPVVSISAEEASEQYGFLGIFMALDMSTSSALTQESLGWRPIGPKLLDDLSKAVAFEDSAELART